MRYGWTLNKRDWDSLFVSSAGIEWKRTNLNTLYQGVVPNMSGVYIICTKPKLNKKPFSVIYNVIYAGYEGVSLKRRFLEHCKTKNEELKKARSCFGYDMDYWFTIVSPDIARSLESYLIECFGPPVNRVRGKIMAKLLDPVPA